MSRASPSAVNQPMRGLGEAWKRLSGLATEAVREGYPGQGAGTGGRDRGPAYRPVPVVGPAGFPLFRKLTDRSEKSNRAKSASEEFLPAAGEPPRRISRWTAAAWSPAGDFRVPMERAPV